MQNIKGHSLSLCLTHNKHNHTYTLIYTQRNQLKIVYIKTTTKTNQKLANAITTKH